MADSLGALLDAIVNSLVIVDAQKDVDLNADADVGAGAIETAKSDIVASARRQASQLAIPFRDGVVRAYQAKKKGQASIEFDDRDPAENAMADALIRYLVGFDLAESRSHETEPGHYVYSISVNWPALEAMAQGANIDLTGTLAAIAPTTGS